MSASRPPPLSTRALWSSALVSPQTGTPAQHTGIKDCRRRQSGAHGSTPAECPLIALKPRHGAGGASCWQRTRRSEADDERLRAARERRSNAAVLEPEVQASGAERDGGTGAWGARAMGLAAGET